MTTEEVWNRAVALSNPTVSDLVALTPHGRSRQVFEHDETLRWLWPNVLFEIPLTAQFSDQASVTSVTLAFFAGYFLAPTLPEIIMRDLPPMRWAELSLPCSAQGLVRYIQTAGVGETRLVTESGHDALVAAWKVYLGALAFEFQPDEGRNDPADSKLVNVTFHYALPHDVPISAHVRRA